MDNAKDDKLSSVQAQFMAGHELIASQFGRHWVPTGRITVVWQGGAPPLGYGLAKQRLVVEPVEAKKVRNIFDRFLQQPSVTELIQELSEQGVKTKAWHTKAGLLRGGRTFDKNVLYKLLNNRM